MSIPRKPDPDDLYLRRKWTFRAHGQQMVVVKNVLEKSSHVFQKAFIWGLYLPLYPSLTVELKLDMRYKPDVVALDQSTNSPLFWGEAGQVGVEKLSRLFRRFPGTHFAVAKWGRAGDWKKILDDLVKPLRRQAPVDFLVFPEDSVEKWVGRGGELELQLGDVLQARWGQKDGLR